MQQMSPQSVLPVTKRENETMKEIFRRLAIGGLVTGIAVAFGYVLFRLVLGEVRMSDAYDVEVAED